LTLTKYFELSYLSLIDTHGRSVTGVPYWEISSVDMKALSASWDQWFYAVGYSGVIETSLHGEPTLVPVYKHDDKDCYYRCLDRLTVEQVPKEDTAIYQFQREKFIRQLASIFWLEKTYAHADVFRVSESVWMLSVGVSAAGVSASIYVVGGFYEHASEVIRYFANMRQPTVVLSTSNFSLPHAGWPEHVSIHRLKDVISQGTHRLIVHDSPVSDDTNDCDGQMADAGCSGVIFNASLNILSIEGKPDWHIKGVRQALAVKYMYRQAKQGRWELPAKEILMAVKAPGQQGGAVRMQSLFSVSSGWENYISSPSRGYYRFNI